MRRSSSLTESRSRSALSPIAAGWPLTVTRPSRISSSALRREAMPARARIFCSRSSLIRPALGVVMPGPWTQAEGAPPRARSPLHLGRGRRRLLLADRILAVFRRLPIGRGLRARDPLRLPGGLAALPILEGCRRLLALLELRRLAQEALLAVVFALLEQLAFARR